MPFWRFYVEPGWQEIDEPLFQGAPDEAETKRADLSRRMCALVCAEAIPEEDGDDGQ